MILKIYTIKVMYIRVRIHMLTALQNYANALYKIKLSHFTFFAYQ